MECCMKSACNGVSLCHVSNTKGCYYCEKCEKPCQDHAQGFIFQPFFHSIHRTAAHFSFGIYLTVFDGQHTLAEFGSNAKCCGNPHPYQCTRAARNHGSGNSYNVSSSNGCCKSCGQCRKRRYIALSSAFRAGFFAEGTFQRIAQISPGKKPGSHCQKYSCSYKQDQHNRSPYKIINPRYDFV